MKKLKVGWMLLFFATVFFSCHNAGQSGESKKAMTKADDTRIHVYYFHSSIRCETCIAVDEHTHQYLEELFPEEMKKGEITFRSINIDKEDATDLVKRYQIYGQTMLFVKGDEVINMTDEAFQYVLTRPGKWKRMVEETINSLR